MNNIPWPRREGRAHPCRARSVQGVEGNTGTSGWGGRLVGHMSEANNGVGWSTSNEGQNIGIAKRLYALDSIVIFREESRQRPPT